MSDSVIRASVSDLANYIASNLSGPPTVDVIINLIQTYIASYGSIDIPLSAVSVDYETNLAEIQSILTNTTTWWDATNAGTGTTLTQMVATALTYNQFALVRAAQETMTPTAVIDSSIYTGTQFLGVRLARRIPAGQPASFTRSGDLTESFEINPYAQFVANRVYLFNRDTIIFPAGVATVTATLYEGQAQSTSFISDGTAYQSFEVGANDYTISDVDTTIVINGIAWSRTAFQQYFDIGLWEYGATDLVFQDMTTPDGNLSINFGNGFNGMIPSAGANIAIGYVSTNGQQGNVDLTGSTITCNDETTITGTVTGRAVNGTNEKSAVDYKTLGPGLFFAKYRAVNRDDQAAIARLYPGVIDAVFEGQQELHPTDLRYMMVTRATILPVVPWSSDDWTNFITWFTKLNIAQQIILQNNPTAVVINISANVFVISNATPLTAIQNLIISKINAAFALRAGVLGYSRYSSDVTKIIEDSDPAIDYYDLILPPDTIISRYQYITLGTVTINVAYSTRTTLS